MYPDEEGRENSAEMFEEMLDEQFSKEAGDEDTETPGTQDDDQG